MIGRETTRGRKQPFTGIGRLAEGASYKGRRKRHGAGDRRKKETATVVRACAHMQARRHAPDAGGAVARHASAQSRFSKPISNHPCMQPRPCRASTRLRWRPTARRGDCRGRWRDCTNAMGNARASTRQVIRSEQLALLNERLGRRRISTPRSHAHSWRK